MLVDTTAGDGWCEQHGGDAATCPPCAVLERVRQTLWRRGEIGWRVQVTEAGWKRIAAHVLCLFPEWVPYQHVAAEGVLLDERPLGFRRPVDPPGGVRRMSAPTETRPASRPASWLRERLGITTGAAALRETLAAEQAAHAATRADLDEARELPTKTEKSTTHDRHDLPVNAGQAGTVTPPPTRRGDERHGFHPPLGRHQRRAQGRPGRGLRELAMRGQTARRQDVQLRDELLERRG